MALPTQCRWVWENSGSWWWTGRTGVLRFMDSQSVGHGWGTELNWINFEIIRWVPVYSTGKKLNYLISLIWKYFTWRGSNNLFAFKNFLSSLYFDVSIFKFGRVFIAVCYHIYLIKLKYSFDTLWYPFAKLRNITWFAFFCRYRKLFFFK